MFEDNCITGTVTIHKNEFRASEGRGFSHIFRLFNRVEFPECGIFEFIGPNREMPKKKITALNFTMFTDDFEKQKRNLTVRDKYSQKKKKMIKRN